MLLLDHFIDCLKFSGGVLKLPICTFGVYKKACRIISPQLFTKITKQRVNPAHGIQSILSDFGSLLNCHRGEWGSQYVKIRCRYTWGIYRWMGEGVCRITSIHVWYILRTGNCSGRDLLYALGSNRFNIPFLFELRKLKYYNMSVNTGKSPGGNRLTAC